MKTFITIFCTLLAGSFFFSYRTAAQIPQPGNTETGMLSGQLSDKNNTPVAYATVTLLRPDGSVVNGNLTDESGRFVITPTGTGTFSLKISAISFTEKILENITLQTGSMKTDLGTITLQGSAHRLEGVEVVSERAAMELSMDKKTFNVERNITSAGGTATDVLQNVPSVSVDNDGNLSLRGRSNVTLLIDGKPATLLGSDAATALQSLPASGIESVEVITNPSAKYDAQGMGGIINIVTKKDRKFGLNGTASIGAGTRDKYNGSINLNMRNDKWNFFLNSSFRSNRNYNYTTTERQNRFYNEAEILNDTFFRTYEDRIRQSFGSFTTGGVEYQMNERNSFTLTENLNIHSWGNNGIADYSRYSGSGALMAKQLRGSESGILSRSLSSSLDYKHKFLREKQELTANVTYVLSQTDREQEYITNNFDGNNNLLYGPILQSGPGSGGNNSLNAQVDYTMPFGGPNGKLDAGAKAQLYSFNSDNNPTITFPGGTPQTDSILLNNFDYNQNVYAAYTSYSGETGKFGYQAGLRLEYATYEGSTLALNGQKYFNDFLNLFPSLFLSYQLSKNQQAQMSYTRRVNRPSFWNLMPFVDLSEPQDTSIGNPGLIPEFIDHIELSYNHKTPQGHNILVSTYYQHTKNLIERYRIFYDNGTSFRQPRNLNSGTTYGVEVTARAQILPIWEATANFNFFQNIINGNNIAPQVNNKGFSWFGKANTSLRLPRQFSVQVNGTYEAPTISLQNTTTALWWLDIAVRKNIYNNRGTIVFNVSDIFNTRKYTHIFDMPVYYQTIYRDRETRVANLTFTWRIGKSETKSFNGRRRDSGRSGQSAPDRDNIRQRDDDGGF